MKKLGIALAAICILLPALTAAPAKGLDSYWSDAGKAYPAAGQFSKPRAWAPGQYVVTGTSVKGKRESVATTLIVRKEEGGWVIETIGVDKKGKESATQMLLAGFDAAMTSGDTSKIELVWMKTLDKDGKVSLVEGPAIGLFKGLMKSTWEKLVVNVSAPTEGGAVAVPAGKFAGTSYIKSTSKVMGQTIEAETWFNSAVPVNGMVKTATTDGKSVTELLAFGTDGKPRIP